MRAPATATPESRRRRRHAAVRQRTVKCWNIVDSCAEQYALYLPGTSLSVFVLVPVNPTDVNVHDFPWDGAEPHSHEHRHEAITHRHPHYPDLHHRHPH